MTTSKNKILVELLNKQLTDIPNDKKMNIYDINRLCNNIKSSIFGDECCIWNGYITKLKNQNKYINFYFKGKKCALHRLLYLNYVGNLDNKEYLKYKCKNKGVCCNINHFHKIEKKITKKNIEIKKNNKEKKKIIDDEKKSIEILKFNDKKKLIIIF